MFRDRIRQEIEIIENKIHPRVRLNSICPYFTMFPLSFPFKALAKAKQNELVFDPFCGRGTTNYAARLLGLNSFGIDSNPVAHAIAQSKIISANPRQIVLLCEKILKTQKIDNIPPGEFWKWAFNEATLVDLCKIRAYLNSKKTLTNADVALRAIILGILHGPLMKEQNSYLSNQMPRTFSTKPDYSIKYWKKRRMIPPPVDLLLLVARRSHYIFNDRLPEKVGGQIILGDSREIKSLNGQKFNWIITSPPYYGMDTYEQDQWLRKWFLGGSEKVDYSRKMQMSHWSENVFLTDLSKVWTNTALLSRTGAKLVVRFGALPSRSRSEPSQLIKKSLELSNSGWKLLTIRNAGKPLDSKRQANQFKNATGTYIEEIDVFAILNN